MVDITTSVERRIHLFTGVTSRGVDLLVWKPVRLMAFLSVSFLYRLREAWNPRAVGVHLQIPDPSQ
jgi:hypothetical protein